MYIFKSIAEEFVKEFYRNFMQRYNGATVLVRRLKKEYVIYEVYAFA